MQPRPLALFALQGAFHLEEWMDATALVKLAGKIMLCAPFIKIGLIQRLSVILVPVIHG